MNLGAIERPQDTRDLMLGKIQPPVDFPPVMAPDISALPTYYQNGQPACGAHAGTFLKVLQESREEGKMMDFSPRFLWANIKKSDGFPLEDGTDMRSIFKTLQSVGVCDANLLANNVELPLRLYANYQQITPDLLENAQPRVIKAYGFIDNPSWNDIKRAIYLNKEVLLLMRFDDSFFRNATPPAPKTTPYGHFVVAYGYDQLYIYIKDSTEKDISKSFKRLSSAWAPFIREVGTAVDMPNWVVKGLTKQVFLLKQLADLYIKLIATKRLAPR